ncbi:hypothetical protein DERP_015361 [Dermatophagoides pteronyssinus]|uniref:Uncharacterized protein n=1 Tax=Dermatophagoides pteronyssinus TaxID=6956 RepID=A0ABQ8JB94_DERPT|nr:hypothetical protein DERP_015361 [Dermatophagoides pteronyssinus]
MFEVPLSLISQVLLRHAWAIWVDNNNSTGRHFGICIIMTDSRKYNLKSKLQKESKLICSSICSTYDRYMAKL